MACYYQTLEITPQSNTEQIAQAYRRLSLQMHPLRNPVAKRAFFTTQFSQVSQAYEVLANNQTRETYDKFGMEGLKNGVAGKPGYVWTGNPFRIFKEFFGSENPWFDQIVQESPMAAEIAEVEQQARAKDIHVIVECSLFEFFNGALKEVFYIETETYEGSSESTEVEKSVQVQVKPGFGENTTLRFLKMGNKAFGAHTSDLVIQFKLKEPCGGFVRDGDNLIYHVNLSLIEALESKPASIKTLDGRSVLITPNE